MSRATSSVSSSSRMSRTVSAIRTVRLRGLTPLVPTTTSSISRTRRTVLVTRSGTTSTDFLRPSSTTSSPKRVSRSTLTTKIRTKLKVGRSHEHAPDERSRSSVERSDNASIKLLHFPVDVVLFLYAIQSHKTEDQERRESQYHQNFQGRCGWHGCKVAV